MFVLQVRKAFRLIYDLVEDVPMGGFFFFFK